MSAAELMGKDVTEQAQLVPSGAVSALELVDAAIARLEGALELNVLVHEEFAAARETARRATVHWRASRSCSRISPNPLVSELGRPPEPDELDSVTWDMVNEGLALTAVDHATAVDELHAQARRAAVAFESADMLLCPTLNTPPPPPGAVSASRVRSPTAGLRLTRRPVGPAPDEAPRRACA
jgi:Asp-tRNA(Asn)/Glu-tRNA(Gln) amidotransferase A subunit family amidase